MVSSSGLTSKIISDISGGLTFLAFAFAAAAAAAAAAAPASSSSSPNKSRSSSYFLAGAAAFFAGAPAGAPPDGLRATSHRATLPNLLITAECFEKLVNHSLKFL